MTGRPKAIGLALALQLIAGTGSLLAQAGVDSLFPVRPAGYLTDVAGAVDGTSAATLDSLAARLRAATGAEMAIVTLPTIDDRTPAEVALAIGRAWGVGQAAEIGDARRNAGLVILLVPRRAGEPNSGQIFISTGQGLEGIVTDAAAGRVRDAMLPQLRAEDYGPGLVTGARLLAGMIARGLGATDSTLTAPQAPPGVSIALLIFLGLILLIVVVTMIRASRGGGPPSGPGSGGRRRHHPHVYWGVPWGRGGGGFGRGGFGGGGGGFGGFGGGGGFSGGGAGGSF